MILELTFWDHRRQKREAQTCLLDPFYPSLFFLDLNVSLNSQSSAKTFPCKVVMRES